MNLWAWVLKTEILICLNWKLLSRGGGRGHVISITYCNYVSTTQLKSDDQSRWKISVWRVQLQPYALKKKKKKNLCTVSSTSTAGIKKTKSKLVSICVRFENGQALKIKRIFVLLSDCLLKWSGKEEVEQFGVLGGLEEQSILRRGKLVCL